MDAISSIVAPGEIKVAVCYVDHVAILKHCMSKFDRLNVKKNISMDFMTNLNIFWIIYHLFFLDGLNVNDEFNWCSEKCWRLCFSNTIEEDALLCIFAYCSEMFSGFLSQILEIKTLYSTTKFHYLFISQISIILRKVNL